jgi:hypothetical protein
MTDPLESLRAADPVKTPPDPLPASVVIDRIRDEASHIETQPRPTRRWIPRLVALAVVAAGLAITVSLVGGPARRTNLDVAAAAARAADPSAGYVHLVSTSEMGSGEATTRIRTELWGDRSRKTFRKLVVIETGTGSPLTNEESVIDGISETWSSRAPDVIVRQRLDAFDWPLSNDPISFVRRAYDAGDLRVAERSELDGRAVWRLSAETRAGSVDASVDANTFVPLEIKVKGSGVVGSVTRYPTFETAATGTAPATTFQLGSHPGARVVLRP